MPTTTPKKSVHLKIAPALWDWVVAQAEATGGSYIQVVEQAIAEMKGRRDVEKR